MPENIFHIWERQRTSANIVNVNSSKLLDHLMEFLRKEVEGEERISLVKGSFDCRNRLDKDTKTTTYKSHGEATAAALVSTTRSKVEKIASCIFCDKSHLSSDCYTARKMSEEDKKKILQKSKCFFICLKEGHNSRDCKTNVSCVICDKRHLVLMCPMLTEKREKKEIELKSEGVDSDKEKKQMLTISLKQFMKKSW